MEINPETEGKDLQRKDILWRNVRYSLIIIGTLLLFILGIEIVVSALESGREESISAIFSTTSNPFTAFFIGVVLTAMMQSSSTTTAIAVAMVASGSIQLESAVAVVMGANLGTTITSMVVSLGFINNRKEFKRAVSASSFHYFFNLFTILILFPLELYNNFLSKISYKVASYFFSNSITIATSKVKVWSLFDPVNDFLQSINPVFAGIVGLIIIFASILLFRRVISSLLLAKSPQAFSRFFFKNRVKSFAWGIITTAAIRSSTITTSVVVPIVSKRITPLRQATPFILGANLGTTITAFFAATLSQSSAGVMSIAIAHFLFNLFGVLVFFPIASMEKVILATAKSFGKICADHKYLILIFILATFFFIPFLIIYVTQ